MSIPELSSPVGQTLFLLARTAPPSALLQSIVAANAMQLVHCVLVQAQPEQMSNALSEQLEAAYQADWQVFVSPQAARAARLLRPDIATCLGRFAAVGVSTAAALNVANVLVPAQGEGAQALLDTPDLQYLPGARVAIYAAPDGLELLASSLTQRGARVLVVPVYRRVASDLTRAQIVQCRAAEIAYVGSVAFLDALLAARAAKPLRVLTPSERVAAAARALGCVAIVCAGTSEQAIADQIERINHSLL